jgi:hypothetical protein
MSNLPAQDTSRYGSNFEMPPGFGSSEVDSGRFEDLFDKKGNMSGDIDKKPALNEVARFMDDMGFPPPHGEKSWSDEVNLEGDLKLNKDESKSMQAAAGMKDAQQKLQALGFSVDLKAMMKPSDEKIPMMA